MRETCVGYDFPEMLLNPEDVDFNYNGEQMTSVIERYFGMPPCIEIVQEKEIVTEQSHNMYLYESMLEEDPIL